jgi:acyl-homoserine lactone acylase PvdQ
MTNTGVDQQDFYLERLNPDDRLEYETPAGWHRFRERRERIAVKGQADETLVVRESRHGPVLSGLEAIDKAFSHPRYVLALRWSALEPTDRTLVAIRALNRARNMADAEHALWTSGSSRSHRCRHTADARWWSRVTAGAPPTTTWWDCACPGWEAARLGRFLPFVKP